MKLKKSCCEVKKEEITDAVKSVFKTLCPSWKGEVYITPYRFKCGEHSRHHIKIEKDKIFSIILEAVKKSEGKNMIHYDYGLKKKKNEFNEFEGLAEDWKCAYEGCKQDIVVGEFGV